MSARDIVITAFLVVLAFALPVAVLELSSEERPCLVEDSVVVERCVHLTSSTKRCRQEVVTTCHERAR